jgi:hypothetical protein
MELVNLVNYKVYMDNKNSGKSKEIKSQVTQAEDYKLQSQSGIYLRDDHCDWGSSGMNEFTNEYTEDK